MLISDDNRPTTNSDTPLDWNMISATMPILCLTGAERDAACHTAPLNG